MPRPRPTTAAALACLAALLAAGLTLRAQDRPKAPRAGRAAEGPDAAAAPPATVQDALVRPFHLPFAQETTLDEVARHLRRTLGAPVVLDESALARLELTPETTVRLELDGVRLKTALQLLLDQVGMTYRVVPEDNLLILTDTYGATDVESRILDELEAIHREVHDLQDAVDDLYDLLAPVEPGPELRNPTIIEELPPGGDAPAPEQPETPRTRAGV